MIDALEPATTSRSSRSGSRATGGGTCCPGPPALPAETGRMPEVVADATALARLAGDDGTPALVLADGSRAAVDVVVPGPARPAGRGRRDPGAARARRRALRRRGGARERPRDGQGDAEGCCGRPPGSRSCPTRWSRSREWRDDPEGVARPRGRRSGSRCSRSRRPSGPRSGSRRWLRSRSSTAAMAEAFRFERKVVVERAIEPVREIECAVLGNDDPVASVCGEIVPRGPRVLRLRGEVPRRARGAAADPAPLEPAVAARIQRLAVARVHRGGVRGHGARRLFPPR